MIYNSTFWLVYACLQHLKCYNFCMSKLPEGVRKKLLDFHNLKNRFLGMKERRDRYKKELDELKAKEKKWKKKERELEDRVHDLEQELKNIAKRKEAKKPKFPVNYSIGQQVNKNRKQSLIRGKKILKSEREKEVLRTEPVYPEGISPENCYVYKTRIINHITDGQKEVVKYVYYREKGWGKNGKIGQVKGVLPRTEYGMEVGIIIAFLVNELGLSRSQTIAILSFFCGLKISSSQVDNLLTQIATLWEKEFDAISDLMVLATVVYVDETGWRVGKKNCYTWGFKSLLHTLMVYGKNRAEDVLDKILPRELFRGTGITDCYQIYVDRFDKAQKCWAHLLRKILKLHLLYPKNKEYENFLKKLGKIFSESKKLKQENLPITEKEKQIIDFRKQIHELCTRKDEKLPKDTPKDHREFVNLQKLLVKNIGDLFTFVINENVDPTSNLIEQALRKTALQRNAYQTSKTDAGACRKSILTSVISSLKQNLPIFSLEMVLEEVIRWQEEGRSMFEKQLAQVQN